jgi:glycosyltransferase involved in cell wall biosynthesis
VNILYVSTLYPPSIGGAQIQLHCLARAMGKAGHEVHTITLSGRNRQDWLRLSTVFPEPEKQYVYEEVPVTQLGFPLSTRLKMAPWAAAYYGLLGPAARQLAALTQPRLEAAAGKPSLVHLTRIGREFIARASLDFARKRGIPFVLTPNHHPRWRGRLYAEYDRIYRESDAILVYTNAEKQTLVEDKGVAAERVHVTGVGPVLADEYSVEAFRERYKIPEPFVLYLGQQYKYKGIEALVKAAPIVWKDHPKMKFVFIGPHTNDSRPLFETVHDPRIVNLGAIDPVMKTSALAGCELLCLPSMQESFGGVYAEAWCYRKAVVGGRIPPIADVVDDGVNGLLSSQDPEELAGKITRLLGDPELCARMGEAGWTKVQENYTWERLAAKTLAVYESVCR